MEQVGQGWGWGELGLCHTASFTTVFWLETLP